MSGDGWFAVEIEVTRRREDSADAKVIRSDERPDLVGLGVSVNWPIDVGTRRLVTMRLDAPSYRGTSVLK